MSEVMSMSSNEFIARTQGPQFTMYAVMKALNLPLTKEQEEFQARLEKKYSHGRVGITNEDGREDR